MVGRLRAGVSIERADGEIRSIARQVAQEFPENEPFGAQVDDLRSMVLGPIEPTLLVLWGAVGFVLLIACANAANLLLTRAVGRDREIAIRSALGASRGRLVRQLLTESLLLSGLGGALGLVLAYWGVGLAVSLVPVGIPRIHEVPIGLDASVLGFALGASLLTGFLFGIAPALQAAGTGPGKALKEEGRGAIGGARGRRLRHLLVVSEVALAMVLLAGAGLMIRSFDRLQRIDLGVRTEGVLTMRIPLRPAVSGDAERVESFYDQLLERVATLPGVQAAAAVSHMPVGGGGQAKGFTVEGRPPAAGLEDVPIVSARQVSPGAPAAMGFPLLRGRFVTERDTRDAPRVAVISEAIARRFFHDEDPLGKEILLEWPEHLAPADALPPGGRYPRWTIVGVVGDVRYEGLARPPGPVVYVHLAQRSEQMLWSPEFLVVRITGDPMNLAAAVREQVRAVDADQPVAEVGTLEGRVQDALGQPRFGLVLLGLFAFLAALLASIGLYGVLASSVAHRTREIGIRMALGARRGDVLKLVVGQAMALILIGMSIGIAAAFALTRLMSGMLFEVGPADPLTFATIAPVLTAVALPACWLPARRAANVDPMVALRYE